MLRWWSRRRRREDGAAAVEFALLVIPFCALVFGAISGGFLLYKSISSSQAAREAARYGSTLTIASTSPADVATYLDSVRTQAIELAGYASAANMSSDQGYVCVAIVPASGSSISTADLTAGVARSGDPSATGLTAGTQSCYDDSLGTGTTRVQVLVHRRAQINYVFNTYDTWLTSKSSMFYERDLP